MSRHELAEPATPKPDPAKTVEVKVIATAAGGLLASVACAVLDAVARDNHVLDGLPTLWRFVILASIPPLLAFLAGYAVPSNRV